MMGTPARGYSWPPFEPGNTVAVRHGAFSARKVDPLAAELAAGLLADRPALAAYPETVWAWARAEARCLLLGEWIGEHGLVDADGETRAPLRYVAQFERLAVDLRGRLGLDPRSAAEIAKSQADAHLAGFDLDAAIARGREVLDAHAADDSEVDA
jgi:hypothetical protein